MTSFFQEQERARRRTTLLVFLFLLAVFGVGCAIYAVVALFLRGPKAEPSIFGIPWDADLFLVVFGLTVTFILLSSLFRIVSLREGGEAVARMLGGRIVSRDTKDVLERRLLNVVDEMAIASGVPVPQVYVLDNETGINAFAAGYSVENAVVAVTRGALENLNRDELQGVIAHEFSHILNGDMRLNIRLIGILFGIFAIALFGRFMVRSAGRTSRKNRGGLAVLLFGLALMLIGYIGVFIGRLIQAAVSRQREFLADASAVQFTRNPAGIGGALLKILRLQNHSLLVTPRAQEAAHLFFGEGMKAAWGLLSTHPPLEERIRRIDPSLLTKSATFISEKQRVEKVEEEVRIPTADALRGAADVMARVGTVASLAGTAEKGNVLPHSVRSALESAEGSSRLIYSLLLDQEPTMRQKQIRLLEEAGENVQLVVDFFQRLGRNQRILALPLLELAVPAIATWPAERQNSFLKIVQSIIAVDEKVSLFEFGLYWLLTRRLQRPKGPTRVLYKSIGQVSKEACEVLAALARCGGNGSEASFAFKRGLDHLPVKSANAMLQEFEAGRLGDLKAVGKALDKLACASLGVRRLVMEALAFCALEDQLVTAEEAELLRLVAVALGLPLPPSVGWLVNAPFDAAKGD